MLIFASKLPAAVWFDFVYIVYKGKRQDLLTHINFDARKYADIPEACAVMAKLQTAAEKAVKINTDWEHAFTNLSELLDFVRGLEGSSSREIKDADLDAAVKVLAAAKDPLPARLRKAAEAADARATAGGTSRGRVTRARS
jgi:hypothetical protein